MERRTCPSCNLNFTSERQSDCYLGTASELEHCWVLSDICPGCNSKGNGRGPVNELLITAYTCSQRKPQV